MNDLVHELILIFFAFCCVISIVLCGVCGVVSTYLLINYIARKLYKIPKVAKIIDYFGYDSRIESLQECSRGEYQYLMLVKRILREGHKEGDRTGTGTLSVFGEKMEFDLSNNVIPLLTTKRVFWNGIVKELLWFISGNTDETKLSNDGIKIWTANATREFLDKTKLYDNEVGDLGPVYGFQWRHWGAEYKNHKTDYTNKGFDQLVECINTIKTSPNSRRIIMSAWNVSDIKKMALPPCHVMCQFRVIEDKLSCLMYQRSCDMGLGVPFNIASYSLLTIMIAKCCGLKPSKFVYMMGDAHIYLNHIPGMTEQVNRIPGPPPTVDIDMENNPNKEIDKIKFEDIHLNNYKPQASIALPLSV